MGQDRESESNPQPKYIGPDNQWAGYPYKPFYIIDYNKTKTELEVILKVILKRILYLVLTLDSSLSYRTFIKQYMYHFKI